MPKILAPGLKLLRGFAYFFTELDECIPKAMRVEVRETGIVKGFTKYGADRWSGTPMFPFKSNCLKVTGIAYYDPAGRKYRVIIAPQFFIPKIWHPLWHYFKHLISYWKKEGVEGFTEFCFHFSGILIC